MTKMKKAVVFMTVLGLTSMLFAEAPKSLKKTATNDLIKDELVDNFAVGVDEAKGLWFGGYDGSYKDFSVGYGQYFGNLWFSVYDNMNTLTLDVLNTKQVDTDAVAKDDVNVDYTDTTTTKTTKDNTARNIDNKLYVAGAMNKIGAQFYWFLEDTTNTTNNKSTTDAYTTADEKKVVTVNKHNAYKAKNTFGFYVNGLKLPETGKALFFVELKDIGLEWNANRDSWKENKTTTYGAEGKLGTADETKKGITRTGDYLKPYAAYNLGFSLPDVGLAQNKFTMYGKFGYSIPLNKTRSTTVKVQNDYDQVVTTTTKTVTKSGVKGSWTNEFNPKLTSTYNFGDKLTAKTAFNAKIETSGSKNNMGGLKTTTTDIETKDVINATTKKTHEETTAIEGTYGYDVTTVKTTVEPNAAFAMNYAVKPNKFDVYVGAKWNAGTLTFEHKTQREKAVTTTSKITTTDEYGVEKVTTNTKTLHVKDTGAAGDAKNESRSFEFKGTNPAQDTLWVGSKLYLTENLQMDLAFTSGLTSFNLMGTNGLLTNSLSVTFAVKF